MTDQEIHIIGAGPAGLTAAIVLARAGLRPVVFEKELDVGSRFHGEFQGLENWSTAEDVTEFLSTIGLDINFECDSRSTGIFFGRAFKRYAIQTDRPWFYLVERGPEQGSLDQGLKRQALDTGVELRFGRKIETATAKQVIVATGPRAADAIALGVIFKTSHEDACFGYLDDRIAPKGYAYLLIHSGKATAATCLFDDFKRSRIYFERLMEAIAETVNPDIHSLRTFRGYVNFSTQPALIRNERFLFVGERSGFQDALWGFGLRYAMFSGYLAAISIIDGSDYSELCRRHLIPRLRTSFTNRMLFEQLGNYGYEWALRRVAEQNVSTTLLAHHRPTRSKHCLYEFAKSRTHTHFHENECSENSCMCVRCRHGVHEDTTSLIGCEEGLSSTSEDGKSRSASSGYRTAKSSQKSTVSNVADICPP